MELAPAMKEMACSEMLISARPALRRTMAFGIRMRVVADHAHHIPEFHFRHVLQRGAFHAGEALMGTESGCSGMVDRVSSMLMRSSWLSPSPIMPPQHRLAGLAHVVDGLQTVVVRAGGDDLTVVFVGGVEVVVVSVQTCILQLHRLFMRKHSQRAAKFKKELVHPFHHVDDFVEVAVIAYLAPCGAHAEACTAGVLRLTCSSQHFFYFKHFMNRHASVITCCLWTISAVFGTRPLVLWKSMSILVLCLDHDKFDGLPQLHRAIP